VSEAPRRAAARFLDAHPGLRRAMAGSTVFAELKRRAAMEIDGERLYLYRGDALGEEEDLYLDALVKGLEGQGELEAQLIAELDEALREAVRRRQRSGS
jgi:hypothetical protein